MRYPHVRFADLFFYVTMNINMFKYSHFVNNSFLSVQFVKLSFSFKTSGFIFFSWEIRPRYKWFQTRTLVTRVWGPTDKELTMFLHVNLLKVPISWLGILHILAVNVHESDVKPGICVTVSTRSYRHTENTSLDFKPNRYYLMKINRNS